MPNFHHMIESDLAELQEKQRYRRLSMILRPDAITAEKEGKRLVSFCSNDYLGMSQHAAIKDAAIGAVHDYGLGSGASRLVTGNHPLYHTLETTLARHKKTQGAMVFGSGYLANVGVISALMNKRDLIIADKLSHACLLDGAKLSEATLLRFKHNDVEDCKALLQKHRSRFDKVLIVTETVFSMDGDCAPVDALYDLAKQYDGWLLVDDAHGLGVLEGYYQCVPDVQMGTLSKAVGCYGGYMCGTKALVDFVQNRARPFIYSTALPPAVLAAAIAALEVIANDRQFAAKPLEHARYFTSLMGEKEATSPIVPLVIGDEEATMALSIKLEQAGFLVWPIRPPTVPVGKSRLRFTFSALHKQKDIAKLAAILNAELA